jgi:hypothetical protein
MDLCTCASKEREYGVGACVNDIIMSDVLYGIGLAESASSVLSYLVRTKTPRVEDKKCHTKTMMSIKLFSVISYRIKKGEDRGSKVSL